jgi:hypothetical protein
MCSLYTKRAVVDPCCVSNRGASLGTPCNCTCVTLKHQMQRQSMLMRQVQKSAN